MYYLKVPETVFLKDSATGNQMVTKTSSGELETVTATMHSFFSETVLKSSEFCKNAISVYKAIKLLETVENTEPNAYIELDDETYGLLRVSCESTEVPFNPAIALQLRPFIEAILEAPTVEPDPTDSLDGNTPVKKKAAKKFPKKKVLKKQ